MLQDHHNRGVSAPCNNYDVHYITENGITGTRIFAALSFANSAEWQDAPQLDATTRSLLKYYEHEAA